MNNNLLSYFKKWFCSPGGPGIALVGATALAMLWSNSMWSESYDRLLHFPLGFHIGGFSLSHSLQHWVNDALMVIFFFAVGLEIKREITIGEMSNLKKALLPCFAALGGMVVPAGIYLFFNLGGEGSMGWGVPVASDIAFAVGILSFMSKRVPYSLKLFLLALCIVDDIGAVLIIALFYSQNINTELLVLASGLILLILLIKHLGVVHIGVYLVLGCMLWFLILNSGVHATLAGVILGLMAPTKVPKTGGSEFSSGKLHSYSEAKAFTKKVYFNYSPVHRLIEDLHPVVNWVIMPVFAFFNAGVALKSDFLFFDFLLHPVSLGVMLGLLFGKPIGILFFSWLAVQFNLASWPTHFSWIRVVGVSCLAGVGFTMALFISHLSFEMESEMSLYSKLAILLASGLAVVVSCSVLMFAKPVQQENDH